MSCKSNSSFGDWAILVNVLFWDNLIFTLSEAIVNMLGNLERFVLELFEIDSVGLSFGEFELFDKVVSETSEGEPSILSERSLWVLVVVVEHVVPYGMEFICGVVVLEGESIASLVARWVLVGVSIAAVEGLVNVSHVVDNESESKGLCFYFTAMDILQFGDGLVSDCVGGVLALQPLVDSWHSHGNVFGIVSDLHFASITAFGDDWSIVKVPVGLPSTASSFVVVSECDALNEWIVFLMLLSEEVTVL